MNDYFRQGFEKRAAKFNLGFKPNMASTLPKPGSLPGGASRAPTATPKPPLAATVGTNQGGSVQRAPMPAVPKLNSQNPMSR